MVNSGMQSPLHESATGTTMILRALARFPERMAFVWDGGSLTYRGALDLIGRLQAAMAAAGLRKGQTVAFLSANSAETWCAGVAALGPGTGHDLAASAGRARRSSRRHRGCRGVGADRRSQDARPARRRARRQGGRAAGGRAHHGQGGFRSRRDGGGRQDRRGGAGRSHRSPTTTRSSTTPAARPASPRARSAATARAPPSTLCGRGRLRVSRRAALSGGGADHPRLRHQGRARAAARRHGASPEGLRAGEIPGHHRAREDQLHADGADDDLRAARSSASSTGPISPRSS